MEKTQAPATAGKTEIAKNTDISASERFTNLVVKEFSANAGELQLSSFQKKLIQNYFIKLDRTLKEAETKRAGKNPSELPLKWENVNMTKLAQDVVALSSVGLDPLQPNQVNLIPMKNNGLNVYDISVIIGFRGLELKAKKYGFETPDAIIIELVYSNDEFKVHKKSVNNPVESYDFEVKNAFDRGEVVGGFYYLHFKDNPEKNRLRVYSLADIEKRKPAYASVEFWGGVKDEWIGGKKTGNKIKLPGWFEEMAYKTIARAAYNSIVIDSEKIDEHFVRVMELESEERQIPEAPEPLEKLRLEVQAETMSEEVDFEDVVGEKEFQEKQAEKASAIRAANSDFKEEPTQNEPGF